MIERFIVLGVLLGAGCAPSARKETSRAEREDKRRFVGWRMAERTYGSLDERWASAGDGRIPADQVALVYEPVYQEERTLVEGLVTERTACEHAARAQYDGPASLSVGHPATVTISMNGPPDIAHVVEFAGSHAGVEILKIEGASSLAGEKSRYLLDGGARARVTFTARTEGRGGLCVSVAGEILGAGWGADVARQR